MTIYYFKNNYFPKVKTGDNFASEASFHHDRGVAFAGEGAFFASGINEGGSVHFATTPNNSFTDLKDWITKSFGDSQPTESEYVPGTFYNRMWRPLACGGSYLSTVPEEQYNSTLIALLILVSKLQNLFETVEPDSLNLHAHGHKIRELLLLACMEIESAWSAILKANGYSSKRRLTTKDYVKLAVPMLLEGYEVRLQSYPNFPVFTPFDNWDSSNPTISLPWYAAYNKTKHDREGNLNVATLENAVKAVGAAVVMFYAQFGCRSVRGRFDQSSVVWQIFNVTPKLQVYEKEFYIPKVELNAGTNGSPMTSRDWTSMNYSFTI